MMKSGVESVLKMCLRGQGKATLNFRELTLALLYVLIAQTFPVNLQE